MSASRSNDSRPTKFAKGLALLCFGWFCVAVVFDSVGGAADDDTGAAVTLEPPPTDAETSVTQVARRFPGSKYNLHILATESFANRLIARTESQTCDVIDHILGADVNGWQTTNSVLTADFKPNRRYGQIDFTVSGLTQSETLGTTNLATVNTLGQHRFLAVKPAWFDGKKFLTSRTTATVAANNINRGVVTAYSGLPIIGELADQQAMNQVARKRSAAEQIAAQRVADRVKPRVNSEIDQHLADVNQLIADQTAKWLSPQKLEPDVTFATTSHDYFRYSAGIKGDTLPVDRPVPADRPHGKSLSIYVHESLFEQIVNRLNLSGLEVSDRTLQHLIRRLGGTVADAADGDDGGDGDLGAASLYSLVFDTQRPAFLDVENGQVKLNLRFAVKPVVGQDVLEGLDDAERSAILAEARALPMQKLSIPLSLSTSEELVAIDPGPVTVVAAKQPTSITTGEEPDEVAPAATDLTTQLIEKALQKKLESLTLPGRFELPLASGRSLSLTIKTAVAKNGWLMLAID